MATSSFKSKTKRTPIGSSSEDSSSNSGRLLRRSRSLSRFSRPLPEEDPPEYIKNAPRGKFVNTARGSAAFPEVSLDDLALEFFSNDNESDWSADRERDGRRGGAGIGRWASDTASSSSRRRGRSVSRSRAAGSMSSVSTGTSGKSVNSVEAGSRRRRSVSVARYRISDSENQPDHSWNSSNCASSKGPKGRNSQMNSSKKSTASSNRRLGRSLSQKNLFHLHDDYSSHSSALTDDESKDAHFGKNGFGKTIKSAYAQKRGEHLHEDIVNSGLYAAMCKELRYAVEEIRTDLNQAIGRNQVVLSDDCLQWEKPEVVQDISPIRKNYTTLEQSEKCKKNLLAEMLLEEQRSREISKIMRELLPDSNSAAIVQKPSRSRKRSNDRSRMSKRLTEEAEKYFEDFISNVEDTDISSFDGERSDGSSNLGGKTRARDVTIAEAKSYQTPAGSSLPAEMDGVIFPWLQWETSHDSNPSGNNKMQSPLTPGTSWADHQKDMNSIQQASSHSTNGRRSWSQGPFGYPMSSRQESGGKGAQSSDMEGYIKLPSNEEVLFEMYRERERINSGGLLLCSSFL